MKVHKLPRHWPWSRAAAAAAVIAACRRRIVERGYPQERPLGDFRKVRTEFYKRAPELGIAMARSTSKDAQALFQSLRSAYAATPTTLKIIDLYVIYAVFTALIQVAYMAIVGSFPFNSFLSGVLSCIGTAVLAVCLRIQVNKENKEFKDLAPERAFADFVLCNLVLHLVIICFLG
ncbi:Dolichyl-diphosphooligosaccharide--protein glycosyltransferase subunit DAD1, partial [Cucurbita argyrosperma subsp. sororia]